MTSIMCPSILTGCFQGYWACHGIDYIHPRVARFFSFVAVSVPRCWGQYRLSRTLRIRTARLQHSRNTNAPKIHLRDVTLTTQMLTTECFFSRFSARTRPPLILNAPVSSRPETTKTASMKNPTAGGRDPPRSHGEAARVLRF